MKSVQMKQGPYLYIRLIYQGQKLSLYLSLFKFLYKHYIFVSSQKLWEALIMT